MTGKAPFYLRSQVAPPRDTIAVCAWAAPAILSLWIAVFRQHHNPFLQKHSFLL